MPFCRADGRQPPRELPKQPDVSPASIVEGKRGDFPHAPRSTLHAPRHRGRRGPSIILKAFSVLAVPLQTPFPDALNAGELLANEAGQRGTAASRRAGTAAKLEAESVHAGDRLFGGMEAPGGCRDCCPTKGALGLTSGWSGDMLWL